MNWQEVEPLTGRTFRRRKSGKQETRRVLDVTLGCDIFYAYGPKLRWKKTVSYEVWKSWQDEAKEIA